MKTLSLCVLAVICGLCVVPAQAELLVNPGFELGAPPPPGWSEGWTPANWFKWGTPGGWAAWKSVSRQAITFFPYNGDKFFVVGAWNVGDSWHIGQVVGVYPGEVFTFSVWAMTENFGTPYGYLLVQWYDVGGIQIGSDEYANLMSGSQVSTYTQYSYETTAAPAGAVTANFQIQGDSQGSVMADDASVKLRYAANDPIPDINASFPPSNTQLQWTRPAPRTSGPVTVDVWFGTSIGGMTKVVTNQAVDSWTISPPLSGSNPVYYWRVDCIDDSITTTGRQWQFYTNAAPVVDAGVKQNIWLAPTTASAVMNAAVTDDNLPNPPAAVTYLWTKDSGPGTVTFTPSATVLKPTASFTTAGDYVLKLTANDSLAASSDTVAIRVFASGNTGLVAEYRLNETSGTTVADSNGGHTGTLMGTVAPTWLPTGGKIGGALQLASISSQYVDCGGGGAVDHNVSPTWADALRNEITVSAWIKLPSAGWPGGNQPWTVVVAKGDSSWRLTRNGNSDTMYFACNGVSASATGTTGVADANWHFVAGTYDGVTIALYIDGILQNSSPASGLIAFNDYDISIGYNEEFGSRWFNGVIDQVRIHNIGLSQAKIREQYTADGGSKICPEYLAGDLNKNCYVDLYDFDLFADNWMLCTDITNPGRCQ